MDETAWKTYYYKLIMGTVQGIQDHREKELLRVDAIRSSIQNPVTKRRLCLLNPYFCWKSSLKKKLKSEAILIYLVYKVLMSFPRTAQFQKN